MRSGKTVLNHTQFLGYTKGPDGVLQIVPEEAEIVRKIFGLYIQGNGVRKIKRYLEEHGIEIKNGMTVDEFAAKCAEIYEKTGYKTIINNPESFIEYLLRADGKLLYDEGK